MGSDVPDHGAVGDVVLFLTNVNLGSTVTRPNLLAMVQNTQHYQFLRVELASTVDCGHPIVKATAARRWPPHI